MTERPVRLDVRDMAGRMGSQADTAHGQRQQPTPHETQRFAQALAGGLPTPASAASSVAGEADQQPQAFPVFHGLMGSSVSATTGAVSTSLDGLRDNLTHLVGRLMVGDGSTSAGGRSLRMELGDDQWPGVSVSVFEDAGAWVAEFRCRQESSFITLAEPSQRMASRLAEALSADAVWRVVSEGLPTGGAWERLVNNDLDGMPSTEAFASCLHKQR